MSGLYWKLVKSYLASPIALYMKKMTKDGKPFQLYDLNRGKSDTQKYFKAEDIQSFDEVDKDEIPPFEGDLREPSRGPFLYWLIILKTI